MQRIDIEERMMKRRCTTFLTGIMRLLVGHLVLAGNLTINDRAALGDLKVGKGVFLVDIGDAKKLNFYLEVIQGTYKGMKDQGVDPDFVLVFIGPSVKYLSTSPSAETEQAAGGVLMEIESNVEALASLGVRQEVCSVATHVFGIDDKTILPGMTLVGDGFISLIGYQAQGYHLVPVF
jgi:intracellular sulfur oxidation DsrE/DsrF family protein